MNCRKWKLVAVGLALLCGACDSPEWTVPSMLSPTAVPEAPPSATPMSVAAPVPVAPAEQPSCSPVEPSRSPYCDREALLAARDALLGTNTDALGTWQRDRPLGSFEGVRVDPSSGRVVAVETRWKTLAGTIPPELGQLGHLQVLDLSRNQLTRTIPVALGQLGQLQVLDLSHNRLTGIIPSELGQMGQLQELDLSYNSLVGSIPSELGQLGQLQELDLSHNSLLGSIPSELGQLGQLQALGLRHNRLSGCIPPELARLGLREWRDVPQNRLTNATPAEPERVNQPVVLPVAGAYTNPTEHWAGQYHVLRRGQQVMATLAVHRSPVGHGVSSQPLFRLPEGYRPRWPMTWTTAARPMTAEGRPLPEAPAVTVILEARPDGTVHHLDAPTLDGAGYAGYRTAMTWITEETAPLLMAGPFIPSAGTGTYRLVRLGNTVTATLAFPSADGLGAGSAHLFTVPAGFRPVEEVTWTVPATARVPVGRDDPEADPEAARGSALELQVHRDGRVVQVDPPRQAGHVVTITWRTADPGWMEVRGTYVPTGGEGTGTYSLRRDGMVVTATVTGAHGVPPASVLFTVPAGFRPVQTVHRPVAADTAGCYIWRKLEVRPQGTVYLAGEPVETGAEPPVHETTMTWTAGADVCQRHPRVQAGLLRALGRSSCAEVSWTDLAEVKGLHLGPDFDSFPTGALDARHGDALPLQAHDLAGLTGLTTLVLQGEARFPAVPADLLVHAPALETLDLSGPRLRLPPSFLAPASGLRWLTLKDADPEVLDFHLPWLHALTLEVPAGQATLPADWLAQVPELQYLTLKGAGLKELPPDLLAPVPELQHLALVARELRELPPDLLAPVPKLQSLFLDTGALRELPPDWLAQVPELQYLTLKGAGLKELPPDLLAPVPKLQELTLELSELRELPPGWLAQVPRLRRLFLDMGALRELPTDWLTANPELRYLTLKSEGLEELPPGWLAHVSRLDSLTLELMGLTELPADLLHAIPELDHLTLKLAGLTTWPSEFLVATTVKWDLKVKAPSLTTLPADFRLSMPHLNDLTLEVPAGRTPLPAGWLIAPELHTLTLEVPAGQATLPADWLVHVPKLRYLTLKAAGLREMPADLLVHVPSLRGLTLEAPELREMPANLLAPTRSLGGLTLEMAGLTTLPPDLLAPAPVLEHLILKMAGLREMPPDFLVHTPRLQCLILEATGLSALPTAFQARLREIQALRACTQFPGLVPVVPLLPS